MATRRRTKVTIMGKMRFLLKTLRSIERKSVASNVANKVTTIDLAQLKGQRKSHHKELTFLQMFQWIQKPHIYVMCRVR